MEVVIGVILMEDYLVNRGCQLNIAIPILTSRTVDYFGFIQEINMQYHQI